MRQLRRLSQEDLSRSANITQGHLSKIENGLTVPSEDVVSKIAAALEVPRGFFSQNDRIFGLPLSLHPMYRKKASVGQHALDYINAELNIRIIHFRRLIKAVNITKRLPFPQYDIQDYDDDPSKIAEMVRRSWLLPRGPIRNLTESVEQAGCVVVWCHFQQTPIYGISYRIPDLPPFIFLNTEQPADRMRFSLAHELGHLVMHHIPSMEMEDQANNFASSLLMPAADIKSTLMGKTTLPSIASLKPIWKTSIQAIIERAVDLGTISQAQHRSLWKQLSASRMRFKEPPELDFTHEQPHMLEAIFDFYRTKLKYTVDQISEILFCDRPDLFSLYPFLNGNGKRHLRLIS